MTFQKIPEGLFDPALKHHLVVAHQDDEVNYTGLIGRWGPDVHFTWMTNGDGLAPFVNADPKEYAELRKTETDEVLKTLGRSLDDRLCLDYSEIEIYDNFVELTLDPANKPDVLEFMYKIGCDIYKEIKDYNADVVWTSQFQNGHPEHDLTHILTAYSIAQINREQGRRMKFYQIPEYEYTILIPFRFNPLYDGVEHELKLTDEELEIKHRALECYPSQVELFKKFEKVINRFGAMASIFGKSLTVDDFLKSERFSPVPPHIDYTKSFHMFEWANYMFDKNKDIKVRFDKHIAVIAKELANRPFK